MVNIRGLFSNSVKLHQSHLVKGQFGPGGVVLVIGLALSILLAPILPAGGLSAAGPIEDEPCAPCAAATARYDAMAAYYGARNEAMAADAARYSALVTYHCAREKAIVAADAARYSAMADYYAVKEEISVATSASPYITLAAYSDRRDRSNEASIAASAERYKAMVAHYRPGGVSCLAP